MSFQLPVTIDIDPETLRLITSIDEFKGQWQAMQTLGPERLQNLRRVATIESVGSSTRIEGEKMSDREVAELYHPVDFESALRTNAPGPCFVRLPIVPGYPADLPRPTVTPCAVAERFRDYIASRSAPGTARPARTVEGS